MNHKNADAENKPVSPADNTGDVQPAAQDKENMS